MSRRITAANLDSGQWLVQKDDITFVTLDSQIDGCHTDVAIDSLGSLRLRDQSLLRPPFDATSPFPLTGAGYLVAPGGLVNDAIDSLGLWRLQGVRQLATLHPPNQAVCPAEPHPCRFAHTRLLHVSNVCALITLMANNAELPAWQTRHAKVAALAHDKLTPAHGDAVKMIDPPSFDEDANVRQAFADAKAEAFLKRHSLDVDLLVRAIQGGGVLGRLLNIADKIAYVADDVVNYLAACDPNGSADYKRAYLEMAAFVGERRLVCGLWDCVRLSTGQAYFEDAARLADFLTLRAMAFRDIYRSASMRHYEVFIDRVVVGHLYRAGQLTAADLLRMADTELDAVVAEFIGVGQIIRSPHLLGDITVESFANVAEAKAREEVLLRERGSSLLTVLDVIGRISPATDLPVLGSDGRVLPLRDAYPQLAAPAEEIVRIDKPVRLHTLATRIAPTRYLEAFYEYSQRAHSAVENA